MHNNLLFERLHYIVIIYYVLTWLVTANHVWMDLTLLIRTISANKKNDIIFESVHYTVLNQNVNTDKKNMFTYPVELTILLITY